MTKFLVICAVAGFLWPKVSVAMIDLGLVDVQFYVICTGHSVETIAVNSAGDEVDLDHDPVPCLMAQIDLHMPQIHLPELPALYELVDYPRPNEATGQLFAQFHRLARAPPRA